MPNARAANAVRLEFAPDSLVQSNLSGAAFTGDWLWVAGDEACGLDRLRLLDPVGREALRFGEVRDFPLGDLLDLPGAVGEEADLEGMAVDGQRLLLGLRGPVLRGWSALSGGKARWLVLYDAPGADRKQGEHTVFGDLLRHD